MQGERCAAIGALAEGLTQYRHAGVYFAGHIVRQLKTGLVERAVVTDQRNVIDATVDRQRANARGHRRIQAGGCVFAGDGNDCPVRAVHNADKTGAFGNIRLSCQIYVSGADIQRTFNNGFQPDTGAIGASRILGPVNLRGADVGHQANQRQPVAGRVIRRNVTGNIDIAAQCACRRRVVGDMNFSKVQGLTAERQVRTD